MDVFNAILQYLKGKRISFDKGSFKIKAERVLTIEEIMVRALSQEIVKEIDAEIIKDLLGKHHE